MLALTPMPKPNGHVFATFGGSRTSTTSTTNHTIANVPLGSPGFNKTVYFFIGAARDTTTQFGVINPAANGQPINIEHEQRSVNAPFVIGSLSTDLDTATVTFDSESTCPAAAVATFIVYRPLRKRPLEIAYGSGSPAATTIDVPTSGYILAFARTSSGTSTATFTWSGASEVEDRNVASRLSFSMALYKNSLEGKKIAHEVSATPSDKNAVLLLLSIR